MVTIIKNIECLVTCCETEASNVINNGFVVIDNKEIIAVGSGEGFKEYESKAYKVIEGAGKTITPGLIDCHTHVVYSGSRENELPLKLKNVSYIDILKSGGGILSTVRKTRAASLEALVEESSKRLDLMLLHGTTTIESKSGYGLNFHDEVKMLKVNKLLDEVHPIEVVSTYMGAHAIPEEYKTNREGYINLMVNEAIPYISQNHLAEFIDCFCEEGVFTIEESKRVLQAGIDYNLKVKLHADEIEAIGGAELAAELGAVSAEHLVGASEEGIRALANKGVCAVLLPATSFYLMLNRFAKARRMIESGVRVALATDCNPGTSPTESLQSIMTFACFGMKLLPEEIIKGMTINAAYAIGRENVVGSIEIGKQADLVIFNCPNINYLIYHFGVNAVQTVIKNGKVVVEQGRLMKGCEV